MFAWIRKLFERPTRTVYRRTGRTAPAPRRRPTIEALEARVVPAFFAPPTFPVGSAPVAQVVGDFNGDGKADLAVVPRRGQRELEHGQRAAG
jgi:hypothetical protein